MTNLSQRIGWRPSLTRSLGEPRQWWQRLGKELGIKNAVVAAVPRIVVIGGGAGGLELASRLGETLGKKGRGRITLIDATLTHLWKPLLHEVAAGTLDSHEDAVDFIAQAHWRHFEFRLGRLCGIDRERKTALLAATLDDQGRLISPPRAVPYDYLVVAIGGVSNDFGVEGVREHCTFLDSREQADKFQHRLLDNFIRAQTQSVPLREGQLNVAIIGAGATGVELAAELHHVARQMVAYGFDRINPERDVNLVLIEAAPRILPALPERLAKPAERELARLNVTVHTGKRVERVTADGVYTADGLFVPAEMKVWAAGVKAPDILREIGGLETNRANQLVVRGTLQTTRDDSIFALGDCASCPRLDHARPVPPTAQAAHQQASMLARTFRRLLAGKSIPQYVYRDYGSLVSLGEYTTVGSLMGRLIGTVRLEGWIARLVYRSLYRMHQRALFGVVRMALITVADFLTRPTRPRMKLH